MHHLQYGSKTPQITLFVVFEWLSHPSIHYLRGHVFSWANRGEKFWGGAVVILTDWYSTREVKITDSDWNHLK